ncbi:hypothetical protein HNO86_24045 [Pseudomonas sp. C1C7]|uniref:c-type cytochrome n=1 Tax=Pseudomonas sp. C1C7 TaxID=2735272 RepID=UPI001586B31C|nr:hypothetical protein [Pseudomonas sp. C1C7]
MDTPFSQVRERLNNRRFTVAGNPQGLSGAGTVFHYRVEANAISSSYEALWGDDSYNWGAGMHRINTAAQFIFENMPLGKSVQLEPQQAWDVAAWINSQQRPQDPRFNGNLASTATAFHHGEQCFYGQTVDGAVVGNSSPVSAR